MGQYAFPQLLLDACNLTVKAVLTASLEECLKDEDKNKAGLSELSFSQLLYLLFAQEYTGLERQKKKGDIDILAENYQLQDSDLDNIWMTSYIYESASQQIKEGQEGNESTWADERALDLIKKAMQPFGDSVDLLMAPYENALEAQNDLRRAGRGDPDAMLELAYQLIEGKGVKKDLLEAEKWARQAADAGSSRDYEANTVADFLYFLRERRQGNKQ